jgi:hypothetical protein
MKILEGGEGVRSEKMARVEIFFRFYDLSLDSCIKP